METELFSFFILHPQHTALLVPNYDAGWKKKTTKQNWDMFTEDILENESLPS